ncbi:MAG: hypothetical protein GC186_10790 [Rhodobacteraceae bacterium]|nr:hypothetical protein [Paracoccaceae bacterium]
MYNRAVEFLRDTDGAVTVDWVVLTGSIVTITLLLLSDMTSGVDIAAKNIPDRAVGVANSIKTINY